MPCCIDATGYVKPKPGASCVTSLLLGSIRRRMDSDSWTARRILSATIGEWYFLVSGTHGNEKAGVWDGDKALPGRVCRKAR